MRPPYSIILVFPLVLFFVISLLFYFSRRSPPSSSLFFHALQQTPPSHLPLLQRVAILGAGAAGCSFAKYLKNAFPHVQLDVFEKENRIGGRVHSSIFEYPALGVRETVEWGASIFVDRNKNILDTFKYFNLTEKKYSDEKLMVLYNGTHIVQTLPTDDSWYSKWIWWIRYRDNTYKLRKLADEVASLLDPIYSSEEAYESYEAMVSALGLKPYTLMTTKEFLEKTFLNSFLKEVVEPITLVNYGNPISVVHSLASLIGFVSGDWYSVKEGNQQLFESLLSSSGASVYKETEVLGITSSTSHWNTHEHTVVTSKGNFSSYQIVVVAMPLDVYSLPIYHQPPHPYQLIHVYHVLGQLNSTTFPQDPGMVFPVFPSSSNLTSITRIARYPAHQLDVFKVFAKGNLTSWHTFFERVVYVEEHAKLAYPILTPQPSYPKLCRGNHVYYLNGMERFLSTMETETIASMNLVRLLKKQFT